MSNEKKKTGDVARKTIADVKKGGDLSLLLEMFGPNAAQWLKRAFWLLVGALVATIVTYQIRASRAAKVAEAEAEFAKAKTVEELTRVASDKAGTALGLQAELAVAQKLFEDEKYSEAMEAFAKCAEADDETVAIRATIGQAETVEAQGAAGDAPDKSRLAEAVQLYDKAAGKAATLDLLGTQVDALLGQSRCERLQGNAEKARELLEEAKKLIDVPEPTRLTASLSPRVEMALRSLDTAELASPAPAEPEEPADEAAEPADETPAPAEKAPAPAKPAEKAPAPAKPAE